MITLWYVYSNIYKKKDFTNRSSQAKVGSCREFHSIST